MAHSILIKGNKFVTRNLLEAGVRESSTDSGLAFSLSFSDYLACTHAKRM